MEKNYILNVKTGKLHFRSYCNHISLKLIEKEDNYKCFATENEAKAQKGLSISWCATCARKREEKLRLKRK